MIVSNTKLTTPIMGTLSVDPMNSFRNYFLEVLVIETQMVHIVVMTVRNPDGVHTIDAFIVAVVLWCNSCVDHICMVVEDEVVFCVHDASMEQRPNVG